MEIKGCPMCGGEARSTKPIYTAPGTKQWGIIQCQKCGLELAREDGEAAAIAAWNKRVSPWIGVSEKPKTKGQYLCVVDAYSWGYNDDKTFYEVVYFDGSVWSKEAPLGAPTRHVHLWMPLPEPPEDKNGG